jgi:hypothetical protein
MLMFLANVNNFENICENEFRWANDQRPPTGFKKPTMLVIVSFGSNFKIGLSIQK